MFLTDLLFATENHFANRELITMVKIRMTQAQKNQTGYQDFLTMTKLAGTPESQPALRCSKNTIIFAIDLSRCYIIQDKWKTKSAMPNTASFYLIHQP